MTPEEIAKLALDGARDQFEERVQALINATRGRCAPPSRGIQDRRGTRDRSWGTRTHRVRVLDRRLQADDRYRICSRLAPGLFPPPGLRPGHDFASVPDAASAFTADRGRKAWVNEDDPVRSLTAHTEGVGDLNDSDGSRHLHGGPEAQYQGGDYWEPVAGSRPPGASSGVSPCLPSARRSWHRSGTCEWARRVPSRVRSLFFSPGCRHFGG